MMIKHLSLIFALLCPVQGVAHKNPNTDGVRLFKANPKVLRRSLYSSRRVAQDTVDFPEGIWSSQGYGYTVDARTASSIRFFDETAISCLPNPAIASGVSGVELNENETSARVTSEESLVDFHFNRYDDFQGGCSNGPTPMLDFADGSYQRDALFIYDVLIQTFAEHYAFFELRNISLPNLASSAASELLSNSTDEELIVAIVSVLAPLEDGHVTFSAKEYDFTFGSKPSPVLVRLFEEFNQQNDADDFEYYVDSQISAIQTNIVGYFDGGVVCGASDDELLWGAISGGTIGYLGIITMEPEDYEYFIEELRRAILDLRDTHVMIIDIRLNGGGSDEVSLAIASHFTNETFLAFTKRSVKVGGGFSPETKVMVDPVSDDALRYSGDVILLTSENTASAAEIFTMTMLELPQVTSMGRNTAGGLSDTLEKFLPNLWTFTLSNEVYLTPGGDLYEVSGIPPSIRPQADTFPLSERDAGVDTWVELAIELAQNMTTNATETESPTTSPVDGRDSNDSGIPRRGHSSLTLFVLIMGGWAAISTI